MRWPEFTPAPMARVAVVAARHQLRAALVALAETGLVEFDDVTAGAEPAARQALTRASGPVVAPRLAMETPDLDELVGAERWDLLAGEAEAQERASHAVGRGPAAALLGWAPEDTLDELRARLARVGAAVVTLPRPASPPPPTQLRGPRLARFFRPLVRTYAVVPYENVDPTVFAGLAYALMFGMMFGDAGHGLVLVGLGALLGRAQRSPFDRVRHLWPFPVAAGLAATGFGLLYGEFFGPTGVLPVLWLNPLEQPLRLLVIGVAVGAVLLALAYALGTVNRWREGGPPLALYAPTGIAGAALFGGAAAAVVGWVADTGVVTRGGVVVAAIGLVLVFVGFLAREPGGGGAAQAVVELFDTVLRLGANVVSFGRLAAFGLTHAAIGHVVWDGTVALWGPGAGAIGAVAVFVIGHAVAFALEGIIVGVQALRLQYYELFSRVITGEGRLFRPWHLPVASVHQNSAYQSSTYEASAHQASADGATASRASARGSAASREGHRS